MKKDKLPAEKAPSQQSPIPLQISMTGNNLQTLSKFELEKLVGDLLKRKSKSEGTKRKFIFAGYSIPDDLQKLPGYDPLPK